MGNGIFLILLLSLPIAAIVTLVILASRSSKEDAKLKEYKKQQIMKDSLWDDEDLIEGDVALLDNEEVEIIIIDRYARVARVELLNGKHITVSLDKLKPIDIKSMSHSTFEPVSISDPKQHIEEAEDMNECKTNTLVKIGRWILSPIGATLAMCVTRLVGILIVNISSSYVGVIDVVGGVISTPLLETIVFVFVGAVIAPTKDKQTIAVVYATILSVLSVMGIVLHFLAPHPNFIEIISSIVSIVGAIISPLIVKEYYK